MGFLWHGPAEPGCVEHISQQNEIRGTREKTDLKTDMIGMQRDEYRTLESRGYRSKTLLSFLHRIFISLDIQIIDRQHLENLVGSNSTQ